MIFDYAKKFYSIKEYPALTQQRLRWLSTRPFEGLNILDATPVFRNTVLKYEALVAGGASLTVGISNVMPYDEEIVNRLRQSGIAVVSAEKNTPIAQDVILDCAGAFSHWPSRLGVSELTRSGAHVYADAGRPVFLADNSKIKRIETCLGTGDGFFRAMAELGYTEWKDKRIVVFGSGKVGTGIIFRAVEVGAIVDVVTDPSTLAPKVRKMVHQYVDYNHADAVRDILRDAYAVVTVTGFKHIVTRYNIENELISNGVLLANMGVEDEFGDTFPLSSVLNEKQPLNFLLDEPTQLRYIDATMALHNEGVRYLIDNPLTSGLIIPPNEMEKEILEITRKEGLITNELDLMLSFI